MSISSEGSLEVRGDFPDAPPCTDSDCIAPRADTWVRGYPSVLYGFNQCNAGTSPAPSPSFPLPLQVDAIAPDLDRHDRLFGRPDRCHLRRRLRPVAQSQFDANSVPNIRHDRGHGLDGLRRPCLVACKPENRNRELTLCDRRDGSSAKDAWSVYANNVYRDGRTAPWGGTFWFVLNKDDAVDHGTVSVDLSSVLASVGQLLQDDYGWDNFDRSYWLDTIPFGMEFGPANGTLTGAGSSSFSFSVSSYCLDTRSTISAAPC